jgi:peroxin-2
MTTQSWGAMHGSRKERVWRWIRSLEKAYNFVWLLNLLVFLHNGKYKSPIERLLGLRMVYAFPQAGRYVDYEFMNRQLVWHAFTEFLVFMVPFMQLDRIYEHMVMAKFSKQMLQALPENVCALCVMDGVGVEHATIQLPAKGDCGCTYCYYCLSTRVLASKDSGWQCVRCGGVNHSVKRC